MTGDSAVTIERETDIVTARQRARELAKSLGLSSTDQTLVALAVSEVARNIVSYARRGTVLVERIDAKGRTGVRIVAADEGPGIPNVDLAMRDGYSTGKSLGVGLPGAKRVMDEFELVSIVGKGTTVTMTKWRAR
ncbi:MAG: anti-sigma regulatory factor [Polyangiaceae bacterium]